MKRLLHKFILLLIALYLTSCGTQEHQTAERSATTSPSPENTEIDATNGTNGQNGKDGKDGKDGANGVNSLEVNEWHDAISDKKWFMGAQGTQGAASSVCTGNYRMPTQSELSDACYRGLFKAYAAKLEVAPQTAAWDVSSGDYINTGTCIAATQATGISSTIVCIQK